MDSLDVQFLEKWDGLSEIQQLATVLSLRLTVCANKALEQETIKKEVRS